MVLLSGMLRRDDQSGEVAGSGTESAEPGRLWRAIWGDGTERCSENRMEALSLTWGCYNLGYQRVERRNRKAVHT